MSISVFSLRGDNNEDARRIELANRVIENLCPSLPGVRLVVLLDAYDWHRLREVGEENRGAFFRLNSSTFAPIDWPSHLIERLVTVDDNRRANLAYEGAVYLHNSTCTVSTSLVMALAHELQHAVQYATNRPVWAYNSVLTRLPPEWIEHLGLEWKDIPIEREARIVAKRVCEEVLGNQETSAYIEDRIRNGTLERDIKDWQFIQSIVTNAERAYDIAIETASLFHRIDAIGYQLSNELSSLRDDPDFSDIHREDAFRAAVPAVGP